MTFAGHLEDEPGAFSSRANLLDFDVKAAADRAQAATNQVQSGRTGLTEAASIGANIDQLSKMAET